MYSTSTDHTVNEYSYDSNKTKSDLFQETRPTQWHCISDTLHIFKKKKKNQYNIIGSG